MSVAVPAARPDPLCATFQRLFAEGAPAPAGAHHAVVLDDPDSVWLCAAGQVDLFTVRRGAEGPAGRRYLLSIGPGEIACGAAAPAEGEALLLVAASGSVVRRAPLPRLLGLLREGQDGHILLERWVARLCDGLAAGARPRSQRDLTAGAEVTVPPGTCVAVTGATALWIVHVAGATHLLGDAALPPSRPGLWDAVLPLGGQAWLSAAAEARLRPLDTATYLQQDPAAEALQRLHRLALAHLARRRAEEEAAAAARLAGQVAADGAALRGALRDMAAALSDRDGAPARQWVERDAPRPVGGHGEPLLAACARLFAALGVVDPPRPPLDGEGRPKARDPLAAIARAARLRVRRVVLTGNWWREDHGPLLAFLGEERRPVALLPTSPRRYALYEPAAPGGTAGGPVRVTRELAAQLQPFAYTFYRRLPDRPLGALDLLRFGLFGCRRDLLTIVLLAAGSGLLGAVPPLCIGLLYDTIIPGAQRLQLLQLCLGLVMALGSAALFELVSGFAVLRTEGRLGAGLQAAIWDRLLDLPTRFFRQYSAGDLAQRAAGVTILVRTLSGAGVGLLMALAFATVNTALLFTYDAKLGWAGITLIGLALLVAAVAGLRQLQVQMPLAVAGGVLDAMVFQLLGGIAKLRVAGAEERAFTRWAGVYTGQRRLALRIRAPLQVFSSAYPLLASLLLYGLAHDSGGLSTGRFIGFIAAFEGSLLGALSLCQMVLSLLPLRFSYLRLRPLLQALPEVDGQKADPGLLTGEIELSRVSFRYHEDGPLVLNDVSLRIRPGEFVAITGPSGCGKSTLLRLLLGFERPTQGAVFYNGQDLSGLDVREVRRQLGVVLQDGKLMADDIFHNIVGSAEMSREEALEAARLAGLERDLQEMPMGLHTLVSEGGSTLSGGQRQRLLIARALVRRPRILLLDEATSALDNQTQAMVSASIEGLAATRVVIAHRLSTIVNADRIIVLMGGRVVQSGTYRELLSQPGPFADLARRQLTGSAAAAPLGPGAGAPGLERPVGVGEGG